MARVPGRLGGIGTGSRYRRISRGATREIRLAEDIEARCRSGVHRGRNLDTALEIA